jgi:hypothetical protein
MARRTNGSGKSRLVNFKMDEGMHVELKDLGKRKDRSMSSLIRRAIRAYIDSQESRHGQR